VDDLELAEVFEDPVPRDLICTAFVDCAAFNKFVATLGVAIRPPAAIAAACLEEGAFVGFVCATFFFELLRDLLEVFDTLKGATWA
jgi:hypothetical protein